jgi:RNA polymerase sigma factor (TIGR02999 family)
LVQLLSSDHFESQGGSVEQPASGEISALLHAWRGGDRAALDKLVPLVYGELRRLAHRYLIQERDCRSLQSTALIHEAYIRLADLNRIEWRDRAHFFAIAVRFMRRILVDRARARAYLKRGGGATTTGLDGAPAVTSKSGLDIVRIDDALNALAHFDPRKAEVVELRFFGGLSEQETAEVLGVSRETVKRDWRMAKLWLLGELTGGGSRHGAGTVA